MLSANRASSPIKLATTAITIASTNMALRHVEDAGRGGRDGETVARSDRKGERGQLRVDQELLRLSRRARGPNHRELNVRDGAARSRPEGANSRSVEAILAG